MPSASDPDFASASTRHLADAEMLTGMGRFDNARYLAGYVVECALKAVVARSGLLARRIGHDLLRGAGEWLDFAVTMSPLYTRYRPDVAAVRAVRDDWSENDRYLRTGVVKKPQADRMVENAKKVWLACVGEMFLDGVLQDFPE